MSCSFIQALERKPVGEARPDERKIDIPGAERTAVTDFGAQQPHDDGSGLPTAASGGNISPERPVIWWMSAIDKNRNEIVQQLDPEEPPIRNALRKLFAEHHGEVSDKWSMYFDVYPRLFEPFRNTPVRLLEIGVQNGGSLRKYSVTFDEPVLASVHSVEFINSLAILRKLAAPENDLGSREIAGCEAPILDVRSPLNGAASQASDETTNLWSLGSTPAEEEIEANRKLVESQQWQ